MALKFVTREHVKVDRVACPWLIKRFIDAEAELLFVPKDQVLIVAEREGALPYDISENIELAHHGDECSFDAFMHKYHLEGDRALVEMAKIVRAADVLSQRDIAPESVGLEAIAFGFRLSGKSDQELLDLQFPMYDALYLYCQQKVRQQRPASLRPTHVVTNFLMRTDTSEPQILIVRRSNRVGSYQGRWAGVSGFVEPNVPPESQAYTEIFEETHLTNEQVRLLRRGEVVEYVDESIGRHFYIHPFLFEVPNPDAIHTDWEAIDMRWIAPSELHNYETVPKLWEVYLSAMHGEEVKQ